MSEAERRRLPYLFKLRITSKRQEDDTEDFLQTRLGRCRPGLAGKKRHATTGGVEQAAPSGYFAPAFKGGHGRCKVWRKSRELAALKKPNWQIKCRRTKLSLIVAIREKLKDIEHYSRVAQNMGHCSVD